MHARILGSVDGRDMGPRFERATLGCKVQSGQGGCRLQGAGIASARREGQVQQGAAGCSGQGAEEVWQVQSAEGGTSRLQG